PRTLWRWQDRSCNACATGGSGRGRCHRSRVGRAFACLQSGRQCPYSSSRSSENTRPFEAEQASKRELARSVEELESLGKVSQAVLEHGDAEQCARAGRIREFDGGWLAVEISLLCFDVSNVLHLVRSGDTCKGCRRQRHGCALVRGRTASRTW